MSIAIIQCRLYCEQPIKQGLQPANVKLNPNNEILKSYLVILQECWLAYLWVEKGRQRGVWQQSA